MKLIGTYRIWHNHSEDGKHYSLHIFKVLDYDPEDKDYFCEHIYYEDSWSFDKEYILENSTQISYWRFLWFKYFG